MLEKAVGLSVRRLEEVGGLLGGPTEVGRVPGVEEGGTEEPVAVCEVAVGEVAMVVSEGVVPGDPGVLRRWLVTGAVEELLGGAGQVVMVSVAGVLSPEVWRRLVVEASGTEGLPGNVGKLALVWVVVSVDILDPGHVLVAELTGASVWGLGDGIEAVGRVPRQWVRSQHSTRTL